MTSTSVSRENRLWLILPFAGLALFAIGWGTLWFIGSNRVTAEMDRLIAREAGFGRQWTCPQRSVRGFPFRVELLCEGPTFRTADGQTEGRLARVVGVAAAQKPTEIILEFHGPLTMRERDGSALEASWTTARSSLHGLPTAISRLSTEVVVPRVTLTGPGVAPLVLTGERLEAHLREGVQPETTGGYDVFLRLTKAIVPPLDAVLRSSEPLDLELDGTMTRLARVNPRDWRATLEGWRMAGGEARVEMLRLAKGPARIEAKGTLRLDQERRPSGRLDAAFINADVLLRAFGVEVGGGRGIGALLGAVLGAPGARANDPALRLPVVLDEGRVAFGPFRTPLRIEPLY